MAAFCSKYNRPIKQNSVSTG